MGKIKFPPDAKVNMESGELHRFSQSEQVVENLRTDMMIYINGERFHVEFQSENDGTMVIRLFEYGFVMAIKEIKSYLKSTKEGIELKYPNQYVIFVEKNRSIPEKELRMKVRLWDGDVKEYAVPLMRYWLETVDTLEQKQLEPLIPLQVFNIRKNLDSIAKSKKPEAEKEKLTEAELRNIIEIYKIVSDKIRELTEKKELLTVFNAKEMLEALQHLSAYLYSNYGAYKKIEKEAIQVGESAWNFVNWFNEVKQEGERKGEKRGIQRGIQKEQQRSKQEKLETAREMFVDGENIIKIKKYSKLPDKDIADVLSGLPTEIQARYSLTVN